MVNTQFTICSPSHQIAIDQRRAKFPKRKWNGGNTSAPTVDLNGKNVNKKDCGKVDASIVSLKRRQEPGLSLEESSFYTDLAQRMQKSVPQKDSKSEVNGKTKAVSKDKNPSLKKLRKDLKEKKKEYSRNKAELAKINEEIAALDDLKAKNQENLKSLFSSKLLAIAMIAVAEKVMEKFSPNEEAQGS